jgi:plasmid maintenance system antidote protein VapI
MARAVEVPPGRINDIVRGKRGITPDTAARLAVYFRTSADLWLNLQISKHASTPRSWAERSFLSSKSVSGPRPATQRLRVIVGPICSAPILGPVNK